MWHTSWFSLALWVLVALANGEHHWEINGKTEGKVEGNYSLPLGLLQVVCVSGPKATGWPSTPLFQVLVTALSLTPSGLGYLQPLPKLWEFCTNPCEFPIYYLYESLYISSIIN